MNIAEIIQDTLRGRPPRRTQRQYHQSDPAAPAEFLKTAVWPLLKEAREQLEARGHFAIATRPAAQDNTHTYSLLILDSSCQNADEACFLRFMILEEKVHLSMRTPARKERNPCPLVPPGNVLLVEDTLAEFIFDCLSNRIKRASEPGGLDEPISACALPATG